MVLTNDAAKSIDILSYSKESTLTTEQKNDRVKELNEKIHELKSEYKQAVKAEKSTIKQLINLAKIEAAEFSNVGGREINLISLLELSIGSTLGGAKPMWAFANPLFKLGEYNGRVQNAFSLRNYYTICNGGFVLNRMVRQLTVNNSSGGSAIFRPSNIPVLPSQARKIVQNKNIQKQSDFIGLLYQPDSWTETNPDPAIIVQWKGCNKYHLLAVWGHDRGLIEEFI